LEPSSKAATLPTPNAEERVSGVRGLHGIVDDLMPPASILFGREFAGIIVRVQLIGVGKGMFFACALRAVQLDLSSRYRNTERFSARNGFPCASRPRAGSRGKVQYSVAKFAFSPIMRGAAI